MRGMINQLPVLNWKEEVLANRRLALLAHSSFEAVEMYFVDQF